MMVTLEDVKVEDNDYEISLAKLTGKQIVDVRGYLSCEFGDVTFKLTELVFADGTAMGIEGEHDFPYLTNYRTEPQPNFDDDTLQRLYDEGQG